MLFPDLKHKGNKQILQRSIWCVLNTHTLYVYIHMYAHSRMDVHIFSRAHVYMNAFMHTHERCMCAYHKHTYTHVRIHMHTHTHTHPTSTTTYFRSTRGKLAMADAYWNLDEKFTNWFFVVWLLGFESRALKIQQLQSWPVAETFVMLSSRTLPLAGLGPRRFEWRVANPSSPRVRCRADPQINSVTLHY